MFTDLHFTSLAPVSANDIRIAFFQKNVAPDLRCGTVFKIIQKCQSGWSHTIRIPWDLSFRLVKPSGNTSPPYHLKTSYSLQKKKFLIWKEGIVTVQQSYGNGKQIIDFEQIKGNAFSSIQFYRGKFLIAELYFRGKYAQFQIDTIITVIENYGGNEMDQMTTENFNSTSLDLDFTGIKSIYLSVNKQTINKLVVHKTEQW